MRKAPLYKDYDLSQYSEPIRGKHFHKGLWFDRFFNRYYYSQWDQYNKNNWQLEDPNTKNTSNNSQDNSKKKWIDTVTGGECGSKNALKQYALQQAKLTTCLKGSSLIASNRWNFAIGMGNNHPVENGFSWHASLGTPYLTGAAVKGLLRTWVEVWSGLEADAMQQKCHRWFGSEKKFPTDGYIEHEKEARENQTGLLIFFDALPIKPVTLGCDIMTPHMGEWYEKGQDINAKNRNKRLPADWHDPNPIPFLVAQQICLQFCIAPRPCSQPILEEELIEVIDCLQMALEFLGAGAKTAVAYGRFKEDNKQSTIFKRSMMSTEDAFRDQLNDTEFSYTDKQIAAMFGKKSRTTQQKFADKGIAWEVIISILFAQKISLIQRWENAPQNTSEAKAYKKLAPYLPKLLISLHQQGQIHYCELPTHTTTQADDFGLTYYQQQSIKPDKILIIGTQNSPWHSLLSAWYQQLLGQELDAIEHLADDVLALMLAQEDNEILQQLTLDSFNKELTTQGIRCTLWLIPISPTPAELTALLTHSLNIKPDQILLDYALSFHHAD